MFHGWFCRCYFHLREREMYLFSHTWNTQIWQFIFVWSIINSCSKAKCMLRMRLLYDGINRFCWKQISELQLSTSTGRKNTRKWIKHRAQWSLSRRFQPWKTFTVRHQAAVIAAVYCDFVSRLFAYYSSCKKQTIHRACYTYDWVFRKPWFVRNLPRLVYMRKYCVN